MLELDDGHALAVIGEKALVRNLARHGLGELVHALDQRDVFVADSRPQAGAKNGDQHGNPFSSET
jgi:hypothetical protein